MTGRRCVGINSCVLLALPGLRQRLANVRQPVERRVWQCRFPSSQRRLDGFGSSLKSAQAPEATSKISSGPKGTRSNLHNSSPRFHCPLIIGLVGPSGLLVGRPPVFGLDVVAEAPQSTEYATCDPPTSPSSARRNRSCAFLTRPEQMSGLSHPDVSCRSKPRSYSITSSARASSAGGRVRANAFAVFRLIRSSNLVA
jgi:hypothetical protein